MKPALLFYPHVGSYSFLLLLAFFSGWLLTRRRSPSFGIDPKHVDNVALLLPLAALFGARFFARLFYAKVSVLEALKFWQGDGLVFYGGLVFGLAAVFLYAIFQYISVVQLCDCLAPSVALGLALGRIGCFLAGCCWGDVCVSEAELQPASSQSVVAQIRTFPSISFSGWPLAVRFPPKSEPFRQHVKYRLIPESAEASLPVHPVQLYEAAAAAVLATFLHFRFKIPQRFRAWGASLALLTGYAVIRFATEFLRADNKVFGLGLTISQVVSIEIILLVMGVVFLRRLLARGTIQEPKAFVSAN